MTPDKVDAARIIEDMKRYYDARAAEYDEWFYRRGRYDHGPEATARWQADVAVVEQALDSFGMAGDILELAPGTGIWTKRLAGYPAVKCITAVDASSEMIRMNQQKVCSDKVDYLKADVFNWRPSLKYDGIFFGFWISHVPTAHFQGFLEMLSGALKTGGKIFFVDSRPDPTMSATNHTLPEEGSEIMKRVLNDGREFDIVKNFFDPQELEEQFGQVQIEMSVKLTPHYFVYGMGQRL